MINHFATCAWLSIGYESYPGEVTWFQNVDDSDFDPTTQSLHNEYTNFYVLGIFEVITTVTTVGYETYSTRTVRELLFIMAIELIGVLLFAFVLSELGNVMMSLNKYKAKRLAEVFSVIYNTKDYRKKHLVYGYLG